MSRPLNVFGIPLEGLSLVEASAGTGKTYSITSLYVRTILEKQLLPAQILVLTYTEAATTELKSRLRTRLRDAWECLANGDSGKDPFLRELLQQNYTQGGEWLRKAIDHFDEAAVFTIHGFCNRLLNERSIDFNVIPDFEVLGDEKELLQECVDECWRQFIRSAARSDYDEMIYEFLTDAGMQPDDLLGHVREILARPYATILPDEQGQEKLHKDLEELKNKFSEIKYYWKEEKDALEELFRGDKLNRNKYRKNKEEEDWQALNSWLEKELPPVNHFERLVQFGLKMSESATKGNEIPVLNINRAIDGYLTLAERLQRITPIFISWIAEKASVLLEERKQQLNALSYDDFLTKTDQALKNDPDGRLRKELAEKYPVALVDEFQDTDPVQYSIFRRIYAGRAGTALFMIGDPKQAIYGFRGADIHTYFRARREVQENQIYTLGENYRSGEAVIASVNDWFSAGRHPFIMKEPEFVPVRFPEQADPKAKLHTGSTEAAAMQLITMSAEEEDEASTKADYTRWVIQSVCNEVQQLLNGDCLIGDRPVEEQDIAILVRKTRQGEDIQQELRARGIKSVLKSKSGVFESREAGELYRFLKAVMDLSDEGGIKAALCTEIAGYTAADLTELMEDEQRWTSVYREFQQFRTIWDEDGVEAVIAAVLHHFNTRKRWAEGPAAERRVTNITHLTELLASAEQSRKIREKNLLKWLFRKINDPDGQSRSEEEELRLESDDKLIQISTIHAAKGLEYPVVFNPFLWDPENKPDKSEVLRFYRKRNLIMDYNIGRETDERSRHKLLHMEENLSESVRLTYVALTRASVANFIHLVPYKNIELSAVIAAAEGAAPTQDRIKAAVDKSKTEYPFSMDEFLEKASGFRNTEVRNQQQPETLAGSFGKDEPDYRFKALAFNRSDLDRYPALLSFSSLSRNLHGQSNGTEEDHDYDELDYYTHRAERDAADKTRFTFPKGAKAGTLLHNLFEDISFRHPDNLEEQIDLHLQQAGFEPEWKPMLKEWVLDSLDHELREGIILGDIEDGDMLKEMEFHFPVNEGRMNDIWNLVRKDAPAGTSMPLPGGFMKGFIDLIFRSGNRYYILDYKSNFLGDDPEDYRETYLNESIKQAGYDLQYHIYSLALHRYLKAVVPDYSYERHFGGVFYLYLRGVRRGRQGSGVYYDRPSQTTIGALNKLMRGQI